MNTHSIIRQTANVPSFQALPSGATPQLPNYGWQTAAICLGIFATACFVYSRPEGIRPLKNKIYKITQKLRGWMPSFGKKDPKVVDLPNDVLAQIAGYLPDSDVFKLAGTCGRFRQLVNEKPIWKNRLVKSGLQPTPGQGSKAAQFRAYNYLKETCKSPIQLSGVRLASPDENLKILGLDEHLVLQGEDRVLVWDLVKEELVNEFNFREGEQVAHYHQGILLVHNIEDNYYSVYDVKTSDPLFESGFDGAKLVFHEGYIIGLSENTGWVLRLSDGEVRQGLPAPSGQGKVACNDGTLFSVGENIRSWDLITGKKNPSIELPPNFPEDLEEKDGRLRKEFPGFSSLDRQSLSAEAGCLKYYRNTSEENAGTTVWDRTTGQVLWNRAEGCTNIKAQGDLIVSTWRARRWSNNSTTRIWDRKAGKEIFSEVTGRDCSWCEFFGDLLFSGDYSGRFEIWDFRKGERLQRDVKLFSDHSRVRSMARWRDRLVVDLYGGELLVSKFKKVQGDVFSHLEIDDVVKGIFFLAAPFLTALGLMHVSAGWSVTRPYLDREWFGIILSLTGLFLGVVACQKSVTFNSGKKEYPRIRTGLLAD